MNRGNVFWNKLSKEEQNTFSNQMFKLILDRKYKVYEARDCIPRPIFFHLLSLFNLFFLFYILYFFYKKKNSFKEYLYICVNPEIRICTTFTWKIMLHERLCGNKNLKKKEDKSLTCQSVELVLALSLIGGRTLVRLARGHVIIVHTVPTAERTSATGLERGGGGGVTEISKILPNKEEN